jgi:hypothetical protein
MQRKWRASQARRITTSVFTAIVPASCSIGIMTARNIGAKYVFYFTWYILYSFHDRFLGLEYLLRVVACKRESAY